MRHSLKNWDKLYSRRIGHAKYPTEMLIRFINSKFPYNKRKNCKVLDFGFGTGRHLIYLSEEGFDTYGIEYSPNGARIAREWLRKKKLNASLVIGSCRDIPFKNEQFDALIDVACIQHNTYGDIKKIISDVYRILKPGGYVFSYLNNRYDSLFKESARLNGGTRVLSGKTEKVDTPTIIYFMSKKDILRLYSSFSKINIEKEEWTYRGLEKKVSHWVVSAQK